ncbi:MAG: hypothetical protein QXN71_03155 [Candidatus Aenigmatarchaeota archaeon]
MLGRNPETIERNYHHHVGLLRQDYKDRKSGRELLTNQPQLLGTNPQTIEANVQFLYSLDIDYNESFLLGTTPQLKRKKMAWMLRELFDYRSLSEEQRRKAVYGLYDFLRDEPETLKKSIASMERNSDKLRKMVAPYKILD